MLLRECKFVRSAEELSLIPEGKLRINTMYAFSFVTAQSDSVFRDAILSGDYLTPDGQSVVWAGKMLKLPSAPRRRIAGWDLFVFEMERLNRRGGKCFFMGSSEKVLALIKEKAAKDYPNIVVETYSPPYKDEFSEEDNRQIISAVNAVDPDLLWIGMTAPKQEKWAYEHWPELDIHCHCGTIGAVFDFYAGTVKRAPEWMQRAGLEWFHRLCSDPGRLWKRYLVGNIKFVFLIIREKFHIFT